MLRSWFRPRRQATADGDAPLEALLEEMRDLRLTLATDLSAAAGAADAGADDVAADIVSADRLELARFARVADARLARLQRIAAAPRGTSGWRRRLTVTLPAIPVITAVAVSAAAATGVLPIPHATNPPTPPRPSVVQPQRADAAPLTASFNRLAHAIDAHASASQVIAAASRLHRQIRQIVARSSTDPRKAARVAELLRMEQSLLLRAQPPGVNVVLDQSRRLAARLVTVLPSVSVPPTPTAPVTVEVSPAPHHQRHVSAAPTGSTSTHASNSPSPKPSHETSAPSPSPSSSDSEGPIGHLPG